MDWKNSPEYAVIGYAYGGAASIAGCKDGPRMLRDRNLIPRLDSLGLKILDCGDISPDLSEDEEKKILRQASKQEKKVLNLAQTAYCCKTLTEEVSTALKHNATPVVLGGDHSLSIGSVTAVSNFFGKQGQDIGLIWIDTHADINTPETSPSKNIFGMSVAFLLGLIPGFLSGLQQHPPAVNPDKLVFVGLRDLDPAEIALINQLGIRAFTMKDVDVRGIASVIDEAVTIAGTGTAGFVVSFDIDVCDSHLVPGTGTPCRGGLTFRESHLLLELIYDSRKTLGFEMVELNPSLDVDYQTAELAISLIESACGKSIL